MGFPASAPDTYGLGGGRDLGFCRDERSQGAGATQGSRRQLGASSCRCFSGTHLRPKGDPIDNLKRRSGQSERTQRQQLDLLQQLNQQHRESRLSETELAARIESFELAYRMQSVAPDVMNVEQETQQTKDLYGVGDPKCDHFARQCLLARRMMEEGVRFVQIYSGGMENQRSWDGHNDIQGNHTQLGETKTYRRLLTDLEERGYSRTHL